MPGTDHRAPLVEAPQGHTTLPEQVAGHRGAGAGPALRTPPDAAERSHGARGGDDREGWGPEASAPLGTTDSFCPCIYVNCPQAWPWPLPPWLLSAWTPILRARAGGRPHGGL